ncbi:helix-turn-helix transcriptional regulator [Conexibacter woesei]|uniref:helix-turn-helix transcriptional regulator n=1 Tax=Conexibacter woesei TaxID=191495 RepID=UPI00041250BB|nr:LuxR family transcriptional regulator [Conexibacter woesei]
MLLERDDTLARLDALLADVTATGSVRVVALGGEAGIGKSAVLRAFRTRNATARMLAGACDALATPRPLGAFADVAESLGGAAEELLATATATPVAVATALADALTPPVVLLLEDLHWADDATFDVLRLLVRRLAGTAALVVLTFRDDEVGRDHPLRVALGELPAGVVVHLPLAPLSPAAVAQLAEHAEHPGADTDGLHARTDGNPFFVTEALAAPGTALPPTIRDAVLARASHLDAGARAALDAIAIEPDGAEQWLVEAQVPDGGAAAIERALASGVLVADGARLRVRHEIAREAIEASIPAPRGVVLHRGALRALTNADRSPDPARLAAHAEAADDAPATVTYATAAGDRATALSSHRAAAGQYARALRHIDDADPRRDVVLERRANACWLIDDVDDAIAARRELLVRAAGDRPGEAEQHRWLARLTWLAGDHEASERHGQRAVALLEGEPGAGAQLARALSDVCSLRMVACRNAEAVALGERAIALAQDAGARDVLTHARNNVGVARLRSGDQGGYVDLAAALDIALDAGLEADAARAYVNLATIAVELREPARAAGHLADGIAYCAERDMGSYLRYMESFRARALLDAGRWDEAAASAAELLQASSPSAPTRIAALAVRARVRARRGDPDVWASLDEALELARGMDELQRAGVVAAARAEARWLHGDDEAIDEETRDTLALAVALGDRWVAGELAVWRRRVGLVDDDAARQLDWVGEPYALELQGDAAGAAAAWAARACPWEAALADPTPAAVEALRALGSRPAATRVARELRAAGTRNVPAGPRVRTRANPAGLTDREIEVLGLVAEGLTNTEIGARLFVSPRTAGHHVVAILRKLDVPNRGQAAAAAARMGLGPPSSSSP